MTDTTAEPTEATPNHSTDHSPPRVIGPWAAYAIVAGSMLGVGIFLFPGKIALEVPTVAAFFAVFLVGGLFALAGSVACGELGAMLPKAGGDYVFQREAFGPSVAFASGWVLFAAIFCGSIASLAVAVFQYDVGPLLGVSVGEMRAPVIGSEAGFSLSWSQLGAVGLILLLTVINDLGARVSGAVQTILTLTPIVAMVGLAAYVLIGQPPVVAPYELMSTGATELTFAGLAAAFVFVNFVFSGWINIIYVASEVKRPSVNIPRSMVSAVFSVTGLYILMCAAFLAVLGIDGLAQSANHWDDGASAMAKVLGNPTLRVIGLLIITVAIVTSLNATVLASARVGFAMAKGGAFWRGATKLSGPRQVPRRALWFGAFLSILIVVSGTFDQIVQMTSVAMLVTGTLTVLSLFVLRRTRPDLPRPYRASLYPFLPALYVILALVAIVATIWHAFAVPSGPGQSPWFPLIGVGVLLVTYVGHLLFRRHTLRAAGVMAAALLAGILFKLTLDASTVWPPTP